MLTSSDFHQGSEFVDYATSPDNFFSILEALDGELMNPIEIAGQESDVIVSPKEGRASVEVEGTSAPRLLVSKKPTSSLFSDIDPKAPAGAGNDLSSPKSNKRKLSNPTEEGQKKISHITVERNRRKQINDNLTVLRSLMPSFYVKKGDQASIVGGVADYISELQQVLRSLEAKKQRKIYSDVVMSPRFISSPRTKGTIVSSLPISPRKPPMSPRLISSLPASPRTPQSIIGHNCSIINNHLHRLLVHQLHPSANNFLSSPTTMTSSSASLLLVPSPSSSNCSTSSITDNDQLVANSKSRVADVEVKFSGPNVILSTVSPRIPGQALKIISALEHLSLEILSVSLNTTDQNTMIYSFTIKIGIECKLSAEELAHQIQQTFY
ncbi:Transcription factor SPEECHLESS [Heracleum sosnowskyi]|uniref:Transcription factor SPEECHLESS n=1 Tax=Heracleum sosnowskyi TaxID=360622 RepID=A0AAD8N2L3_9APIA|nr:Transcription factor SPEECHLESS [Heracleum sosnowskyi]